MQNITTPIRNKAMPKQCGVQQSLCSKLKERTHHMLQKETIRATDDFKLSYRVMVPKFAEN